MNGITSIGIYIPIYRLKREEIARIWVVHAIGGEKAVAGYDEDHLGPGKGRDQNHALRGRTTCPRKLCSWVSWT